MSNHDYLCDSKNPFFSLEDDIDDETFLKSGPNRSLSVSNSNPYANFDDKIDQQRQELVERRKAIEERTIKSSERSISLLRDSEQIGSATAEELLRQREQLKRTEKRLDDINNTLRFSQKHIQGIKSVFGSLKNYLSGKSGDLPTPTSGSGSSNMLENEQSGSSSSSMVLNDTLEYTRNNLAANHPSLQRRGLLDDDTLDDNHQLDPTTKVSRVLEQNLDEMSGSLARLKGLAIGLSEEIESQNDLIENVINKTDKADIMIERQNKDMKYLLKK